jgi:hypothetical protein
MPRTEQQKEHLTTLLIALVMPTVIIIGGVFISVAIFGHLSAPNPQSLNLPNLP